MGHAS
jgi:hypothetical protein